MPKKGKNSSVAKDSNQPFVPTTGEQSKKIDSIADELKVAPSYVRVRQANIDPAFMDFAFKIAGLEEAKVSELGWDRKAILDLAKKESVFYNKAIQMANDDRYRHLYEQSGGNIAEFAAQLRAVAVKKKTEEMLDAAIKEKKLLEDIIIPVNGSDGVALKF